jgi:two-component system, cell cycle sensor histidine kinase and response regulator CckA
MPTVLIVDDEPAILSCLESALQSAGIEVLTAATGQEAVSLYRQHARDINIVVLDVMMPDMDGPATLQALTAINSNVRCFFATGASDNTLRRVCSRQVVGVITKPFMLPELTELLMTYVNSPRHALPADSVEPDPA